MIIDIYFIPYFTDREVGMVVARCFFLLTKLSKTLVYKENASSISTLYMYMYIKGPLLNVFKEIIIYRDVYDELSLF